MSRHIFDENFSAPLIEIIRYKLSSVTQVGKDWGHSGWKDRDQIIPHLHGSGATFHTLDRGFYDWRLWHKDYCLVYYDVPEAEIIEWVFKFLNHRTFDTRAKRMGKVIKVLPAQITYWALKDHQFQLIQWY
jgi:hypothetical protein